MNELINYITYFYLNGDYFAIECSTYEQPHDVQPHDVYVDRKRHAIVKYLFTTDFVI